MISAKLFNVLRGTTSAPLAVEAPESGPAMGPDEETVRCTEKHKHHTKMCRKAPTPASRALHRKLRDHYAAKIGK